MMGNCFDKGKNSKQDQGHVTENQVEPRNSKTQPSKMTGEKRKRTSPPKESKKQKTKKTPRSKGGNERVKKGEVFMNIPESQETPETSGYNTSGSVTSRSTDNYKVSESHYDQGTNRNVRTPMVPMDVEASGHLQPNNSASNSGDIVQEKYTDASKSDDRQKEIDDLKSKLEDTEKRIKDTEKGKEDTEKRVKEKEMEIKEINSRYTKELKNRDNQISALKSRVADLTTEKDELLIRLSAVAGARLLDNNPNVADLSDGNRPTKLAEKYTELYDNQWTDAYTELENSGLTDQQAIKLLLGVLITTYKVCKEKADSQLKGLHEPLFLEPNATIPHELNKQLKENRKRNYKMHLPKLATMVDEKLENLESMSAPRLGGASLRIYCNTCLELTWLMCIQDPPVYIDCNVALRAKKFDKNRFKEYTQSGPLVDFVVWPVLYLQEDGAMLSKGTVQCTKSKEDTVDPRKVLGKHRTTLPVGAQTVPVGSTLQGMMNVEVDGKQQRKKGDTKSATFSGGDGSTNNHPLNENKADNDEVSSTQF